MAWSADGAFLALHNENMPHALFIWSAQSLELVSVLVQVESPADCLKLNLSYLPLAAILHCIFIKGCLQACLELSFCSSPLLGFLIRDRAAHLHASDVSMYMWLFKYTLQPQKCQTQSSCCSGTLQPQKHQ